MATTVRLYCGSTHAMFQVSFFFFGFFSGGGGGGGGGSLFSLLNLTSACSMLVAFIALSLRCRSWRSMIRGAGGITCSCILPPATLTMCSSRTSTCVVSFKNNATFTCEQTKGQFCLREIPRGSWLIYAHECCIAVNTYMDLLRVPQQAIICTITYVLSEVRTSSTKISDVFFFVRFAAFKTHDINYKSQKVTNPSKKCQKQSVQKFADAKMLKAT